MPGSQTGTNSDWVGVLVFVNQKLNFGGVYCHSC